MTTAQIFHDLCRYPKWQVDQIDVNIDTIKVYGWALAYRDDIESVDLLLNGVKPLSVEWKKSALLHKVFPYLKESEAFGFAATYKFAIIPDVFRLSYVGRYSQEPFDKWMDIYFPYAIWKEKKFFVPEGDRMKRTQGNDNVFRYVLYGFTVASQLNSVLETYFGKNLGDFEMICDWGVGCGRVAQMVHFLVPETNIVGIDIDADNIEWCAKHLPFGRYEATELYPPTRIPGGSIDLLYGISIFTHLKLDAFTAWVGELARMLRPGGIALVTIAGGAGLMRAGGNNTALIERVLLTGFDDGSRDSALDKAIDDKDYYRGTFVMHRRATELFSEKFRVRDILRQANGASQDLMVCERR